MRKAEAEQRLDARNRRVGEHLDRIDQGGPVTGLDDGVLTRMSIRLPTVDEPETFLVVKASSSTGDYVAFVGGLSIVQVMLMWRAKEQAAGLSWREDVPWAER